MDTFHPVIKQWFQDSFKAPLDIQKKTWEAASAGRNALVCAPTGSGKTFAAFLYGLNQLFTSAWPADQTSILYVSPLKALNSDIGHNLLQPLYEIRSYFMKAGIIAPEVSVKLRSGDTTPHERRQIFKDPPSVFITTPETLFLLLSQEKGIQLLSHIRCVILDEIHSIAESKRGTVLATSLERLSAINSAFIRIGLSATVNPASEIAAFLAGYERTPHDTYKMRQVELIMTDVRKQYDIRLEQPIHASGSYGDSYWQEIAKHIDGHLQNHRSTLIFVNSRKMAETVSRFLNGRYDSVIAYAHHGSLSKNLRKNVEHMMREGKLKAVVATNSLELGIDIGYIELVIFLQPPFTVSSFVQKLGRAGHQVGAVSKSICIPLTDLDTFQFNGYLDALSKGELEELHIPKAPLDVLSQIIISAALCSPFKGRTLYDSLKQSYPYRNMEYNEYCQLITFLSGSFKGLPVKETRKRIIYDMETDTVSANDGTRLVFYANGGTIPDRGYYAMQTSDSHAVGELDEEFVWERKKGDVFVFGNRKWKIENISSHTVTVQPWQGRENSTVFWKAEEVVSPELPYAKTRESLIRDVPEVPGNNVSHLTSYLLKHELIFEKKKVLFEHTANPAAGNIQKYIFIHTFLGGKINKALQFGMQGYFQKEGIQAQVHSNNRQVFIIAFDDLHFSFERISSSFLSFLYSSLENSGFFGARFREIANRFLVLPSPGFNKRFPLWINRIKAKEFYSRIKHYKDNPVTKETWREILEDVLDIEGAEAFIEAIVSGSLSEKIIHTPHPSPLCDDSIFRLTNVLMYADDTPPQTGSSSSISLEYFHSLTKTGNFSISIEQLQDFEAKLKSLTQEYCPGNLKEIIAYIDERIIVPIEEWQTLVGFYPNETDELDNADGIYRLASNEVAGMVTKQGFNILSQIFCLQDTSYSLTKPNGATTSVIRPIASSESPEHTEFLKYLLAYYGPITMERLAALYGFHRQWLDTTAAALASGDDQILYCDLFTHEEGTHIILLDILEKLLRYRKYHIPEVLFKYAELETILYARYHTEYRLHDKIAALLYSPLSINEWTDTVLPMHLSLEERKAFDELLQERLVMPICLDKKIVFIEPDMAEELIPSNKKSQVVPERGSFSFWELKDMTKLSAKDLIKTLKKDFSGTQISCDSLSGIATMFNAQKALADDKEPVNFSQWKQKRLIGGNWYSIRKKEASVPDTVEALEDEKAKVRLLLKKYGIISAEILSAELKPFRISSLYRALRIMELSGEIITGYFIRDKRQRQFTTKGFLTKLNEANQNTLTIFGFYKDPEHVGRFAGASGTGMRSPYFFIRQNTNEYIMYYPKQRSLTGLTETNLCMLPDFIRRIPLDEVRIETVDGTPVMEHPLYESLLEAGGIRIRNGIRYDSYSLAGR